MDLVSLAILGLCGILAGFLAGFLGIGGGTILVPLLVALGRSPIQAVGTSTLAIAITALSGTLQNWRMGVLQPWAVMALGLPALGAAQCGVYLAGLFSEAGLLVGFGLLLLLNLYLFQLRRRAIARGSSSPPHRPLQSPMLARIGTGGLAGLLAGLFGVGGGIILVPLQILLLGDALKVAIQTSLGVIVLTALSACIGHAVHGNVLFAPGIILGLGGWLGAQVSTRWLPKLPDHLVGLAFRSLLVLLAIYTFWQAFRLATG
ncbi:sulfite exporter TauE/SafE family protein [Lyngbya confervoides]|uniref:Probable membrane transporter protein n=1 Tax=Lyngbya confervoides BDU141951 TaxID=1574623 RepID=A0ABD4T1H8_9CYAN|nr:sulfite exporter TauE/SafE family protein [Lyngbya confervoides]MCM1982562.1 sulfite exporter TauE/SafE family protein [Lyngbya confervoides BDU141951]